MVSQVSLAAILMIVHGVMLTLMALLYAVAGPMMFTLLEMENKGNVPMPPAQKTMLTFLTGYYIVYGVVILIVGIMHIIAGIKTLRFRARIFALVTLFSNVLVLLTCYCMPTGIGMMIFGLIVLFNGDVVRAYAMAGTGATPEEIREAFLPGRRFRAVVDEYDERGRPERGRPDDRIEPD